MGRKLPPGEAERRAKERARKRWADMASGAAYTKFDPNDGIGYGSKEQWQGTAEARLNGRLPKAAPKVDADLVLLDLTAMPETLKALTHAYRLASKDAHPDAPTGSHEAFLKLTEAYQRLQAGLAQPKAKPSPKARARR